MLVNGDTYSRAADMNVAIDSLTQEIALNAGLISPMTFEQHWLAAQQQVKKSA